MADSRAANAIRIGSDVRLAAPHAPRTSHLSIVILSAMSPSVTAPLLPIPSSAVASLDTPEQQGFTNRPALMSKRMLPTMRYRPNGSGIGGGGPAPGTVGIEQATNIPLRMHVGPHGTIKPDRAIHRSPCTGELPTFGKAYGAVGTLLVAVGAGAPGCPITSAERR
jgi:hypothetical protein